MSESNTKIAVHTPTFKPSNFTYSKSNILYNHQGIDTIRLVAKYDTVAKLCQRLGLDLTTPKSNTPLSNKLIELNQLSDPSTRYKQDDFKPTLEVVKLSKGKALSNLMTITRNTPFLHDHATQQKKAKGTYCMIEFAGLHQPTTYIHKEAIGLISKFLKRKAFKVYSVDVAIDTKDKQPINYKRKLDVNPVKQHKLKKVVSHGSSIYINNPKSQNIGRVLYYDKHHKETVHHKKSLSPSLREWKRLEVTIIPYTDLTPKRVNFIDYINSPHFLDAMADVQQIAHKQKIRAYDDTYLTYQLNSFIDNRVMNNKESKKRFNSKESIERFRQSDFRRYTLAL